MTRLRLLIKEVLSTPPKKKDCGCGCNDCDGKAPIITEGRIKKAISEGLTYHVENKIPLHESVYRIGSEKHFALINEARKLWVRGLIDVSEDDQAILETHLGNFGMYEGKKVPLDMPMVNEEDKSFDFPMEFTLEKDINYNSWGVHEDKLYKGTFVKDLILSDHKRAIYVNHEGKQEVTLDQDDIRNLERLGVLKESLDEAKKKKKKDPPIGKPKRGGSKAYYVYVRDPKTKRIKKVSFGSGGLRAKIRNPKARKAFAARHRCSEKNDRTKASYWSCRLPRYAKQLGLGANMNTFW